MGAFVNVLDKMPKDYPTGGSDVFSRLELHQELSTLHRVMYAELEDFCRLQAR